MTPCAKNAFPCLWLCLGLWVSCPAKAASEEAGADVAYQNAQAALNTQAWAEAELQLERVLMLNPEHAEARIQLAILLAQRGRLVAANGFLQSLIEDPRTPPAHRQRLLDLLGQLKIAPQPTATASQPLAPMPGQAPSIVQARMSLGYTSNPYARANIDTLTLTTPGGNTDLTVAPNISSAPTLTSSLSYMAPNLCGFEVYDQHWYAQERYATNKVALFCRNSVAGQKIQTFVSYLNGLDGGNRASAGLRWSTGAMLLTGQAFNEPQLDRRGYSLRAEHLQLNTAGAHTLVYAEAEKSNTGLGDNFQTGLVKEVVLVPALTLLVHVSAQRDFGGYSTFLENGARRNLLYAELGLQKDWGKHRDWNLGSSLYTRRRWSNLALFGFKDTTLQITIDRSF